MREQVLNDIIKAMKEKDKEKLAVLRMVKGAMQLEEINKKRELTTEEMIGVFSKQIKTRKESIIDFEKGNRQDLIDQANLEINILNEYMPEQLTDEEVKNIIEEAFCILNPTGTSDMGKIMKEITPKLKGKADMSSVSKIIREKLSNL